MRKENVYIQEGDLCKIECYDKNGDITGYAIVDIEDMDRCKPYRWCLSGGYIVNSRTKIRLHHFIMNHKPSKHNPVDHKDRNIWNNQKFNLRVTTVSCNNCNRVFHSNSTGHKNIYTCGNTKLLQVRVQKKSRKIIKYCKTIEEAILVRDAALIKLHGKYTPATQGMRIR